jgi:hypothetical protein
MATMESRHADRSSRCRKASEKPVEDHRQGVSIMSERIKNIARSIAQNLRTSAGRLASATGAAANHLGGRLPGARVGMIAAAIAGIGIYAVVQHPPMQTVDRGEVGLRINQLTGDVSEFRDGAVIVIPDLYATSITLRSKT